jgi:uncharacterized coiled-coil protein SlyX
MQIPRRWTAGVVLALAMLSGCASAPTAQVRQFGTASESLTQSVGDSFELIDRAVVDRKLYDLASDPASSPDDNSFQGVFRRSTTGEATQTDALDVRLAVLDALGRYAGSVGRLATADVAADIEKAAVELNGALLSLRDHYAKLNGGESILGDRDLTMVATVVNSIGQAIAEAQRVRALRSIVEATDPAVQQIAATLAKELGAGSELARLTRMSLDTTVGSLQQAYNREKQASSFDRRLAALERIQATRQRAETIDSFFATVAESSATLANAHAQLKKALRQPNPFSHRELTQSVSLLAERAQAAKRFHGRLMEDQR